MLSLLKVSNVVVLKSKLIASRDLGLLISLFPGKFKLLSEKLDWISMIIYESVANPNLLKCVYFFSVSLFFVTKILQSLELLDCELEVLELQVDLSLEFKSLEDDWKIICLLADFNGASPCLLNRLLLTLYILALEVVCPLVKDLLHMVHAVKDSLVLVNHSEYFIIMMVFKGPYMMRAFNVNPLHWLSSLDLGVHLLWIYILVFLCITLQKFDHVSELHGNWLLSSSSFQSLYRVALLAQFPICWESLDEPHAFFQWTAWKLGYIVILLQRIIINACTFEILTVSCDILGFVQRRLVSVLQSLLLRVNLQRNNPACNTSRLC